MGSARNGALLRTPAACAVVWCQAQREPRLCLRKVGEWHFQQKKAVEVQSCAAMSSMHPGLEPCGPAPGGVGLMWREDSSECSGERGHVSEHGSVRAQVPGWPPGPAAEVGKPARRRNLTSASNQTQSSPDVQKEAPKHLLGNKAETRESPRKSPTIFQDAEGSAELRKAPALAPHV